MSHSVSAVEERTIRDSSMRPARLSNLVVVGVTNSASSWNALRWAAAEAARRKADLHLVHAYTAPHFAAPIGSDVDELLRDEGLTLLTKMANAARRENPLLHVSTALVRGAAVNALQHQSRTAALTVVGSKESSRLTGALLGSVASAVAAVNSAPVAVIHPDHRVNTTGPVVVGVDGTAGSDAAIKFAFEEAAARRSGLLAVHARMAPAVDGNRPGHPVPVDPAAIDRVAAAALSGRLAKWCDKYPQVRVDWSVRPGHSAPVLLAHSRTASIMVVGRRPRSEVTALVLGSTSRALTVHSACPVVVVREAQ